MFIFNYKIQRLLKHFLSKIRKYNFIFLKDIYNWVLGIGDKK